MTSYTKIILLIFSLFSVLPNTVIAANDSPWYLSASANIHLNVFSKKSKAIDSQTELSFFVDADYIDTYGLGIGLIHQNQKSFSDISNSILYLSGRYHIYPESLPGKVSLSLDTYNESENSTIKTNSAITPGPGPGAPPIVTITTELINDSLSVYNPVISFLNYNKSFYADIGYAYSRYGSSDIEVNKLRVKQWTPTVGFSINNLNAWITLRHYNIKLSNDDRSPGATNTTANEIKLTHWVSKTDDSSLDNIQLAIITGDRLFAVDHDARKIYSISDMQKAALSIGGEWKYNSSELYIYTGLEKYKNIFSNNDYYNAFIYAGFKTHW